MPVDKASSALDSGNPYLRSIMVSTSMLFVVGSSFMTLFLLGDPSCDLDFLLIFCINFLDTLLKYGRTVIMFMSLISLLISLRLSIEASTMAVEGRSWEKGRFRFSLSIICCLDILSGESIWLNSADLSLLLIWPVVFGRESKPQFALPRVLGRVEYALATCTLDLRF